MKKVSASGTLVYLSGGPARSERLEAAGGAVTWTDYLMAGGRRLVEQKVTRPDASTALRYFVLDHLGSVAVVTDEVGAVVERLSFDAWGKRRNPDGSPDPAGALTSQAVRGFTGHEMLDELDLVHMNGRIYEPQLARFLSADPMVEDAASTQGLNRYTYVLNRPLSLTDPTGHWSLWHTMKKTPALKAVVAIAAAVTMQYYVMPAYFGVAGFSALTGGQAFVAVVASGVAGGAVATGTVKGALIGGLTAAAFYGVGEATGFHAKDLAAAPDNKFLTGAHFANMAGHAAVGCASSAAQGGSCGSGALAAGFGSAVSPKLVGLDLVSGTVASSVAGGVGSVLGGGKFENGAVTGAFGYLFNACGGKNGCALFGGAVGTGVGVAASAACDAGTAGACVAANPAMVAASGSAGAAIGAAVDAAVDGVHGNSMDSQRQTYVYQLVDQTSGDVLKYGITSEADPTTRYSRSFYAGTNSRMDVLATYSNRGFCQSA